MRYIQKVISHFHSHRDHISHLWPFCYAEGDSNTPQYVLYAYSYVDDPKRRRRSIYTAREILEDYLAIPSDYILRRREGAA